MAVEFKTSPLDRTAKLTTLITVIGAGIVTLGFIYLMPFLFAPRKYLLSSRGIIIRSIIDSVIIEKDNIRFAEVVGPLKPGAGIRTCTGAFFGYAGDFVLEDGSMAKVYATNWNSMVRITTYKGDPYLLSPADPNWNTEGRFFCVGKNAYILKIFLSGTVMARSFCLLSVLRI